MYDEAQEKFKGLKEEERFFFKIVRSKKRKTGVPYSKNDGTSASASGPFAVTSTS
jgi:hypothetical protein